MLIGKTFGQELIDAGIGNGVSFAIGEDSTEITVAEYVGQEDRDSLAVVVSNHVSTATNEASIRAEYASKLQLIKTPYHPEERETWFKQLHEVDKYLADNTYVPIFLLAEVETSGETLEELIANIQAKDLLYSQAAGAIVGAQRKALAELE